MYTEQKNINGTSDYIVQLFGTNRTKIISSDQLDYEAKRGRTFTDVYMDLMKEGITKRIREFNGNLYTTSTLDCLLMDYYNGIKHLSGDGFVGSMYQYRQILMKWLNTYYVNDNTGSYTKKLILKFFEDITKLLCWIDENAERLKLTLNVQGKKEGKAS